MVSACKIERQNVISANSIDVNKSINKMLIPDRNILPPRVIQTNLGRSWGFSSNNHVQTAYESHDLNMVLKENR